jgi:hypothetical protein
LDRIGVVCYDDMQAAPDPALRQLFDSFALTVTYDVRDHMARCAVTLDDITTGATAAAVAAVGGPDGQSSGAPEAGATSPDSAQLGISIARSEGFEPPTL